MKDHNDRARRLSRLLMWLRCCTGQVRIQLSEEDWVALDALGDEEALALWGTILRECGIPPLAVRSALDELRANPALMRKAFAVAAQ